MSYDGRGGVAELAGECDADCRIEDSLQVESLDGIRCERIRSVLSNGGHERRRHGRLLRDLIE